MKRVIVETGVILVAGLLIQVSTLQPYSWVIMLVALILAVLIIAGVFPFLRE